MMMNTPKTIKEAMQICGTLAWEHGMKKLPEVVYCVRCERRAGKSWLRISEWFGTEAEATARMEHFATRPNDVRAVRVHKYCKGTYRP